MSLNTERFRWHKMNAEKRRQMQMNVDGCRWLKMNRDKCWWMQMNADWCRLMKIDEDWWRLMKMNPDQLSCLQMDSKKDLDGWRWLTIHANGCRSMQMVLTDWCRLEGVSRYAGLLLAPAKDFAIQPMFLLPFCSKLFKPVQIS